MGRLRSRRAVRGQVRSRLLLNRFERKYGNPKALSILAHGLGRAVYFMLARKQAFDPERFTKS